MPGNDIFNTGDLDRLVNKAFAPPPRTALDSGQTDIENWQFEFTPEEWEEEQRKARLEELRNRMQAKRELEDNSPEGRRKAIEAQLAAGPDQTLQFNNLMRANLIPNATPDMQTNIRSIPNTPPNSGVGTPIQEVSLTKTFGQKEYDNFLDNLLTEPEDIPSDAPDVDALTQKVFPDFTFEQVNDIFQNDFPAFKNYIQQGGINPDKDQLLRLMGYSDDDIAQLFPQPQLTPEQRVQQFDISQGRTPIAQTPARQSRIDPALQALSGLRETLSGDQFKRGQVPTPQPQGSPLSAQGTIGEGIQFTPFPSREFSQIDQLGLSGTEAFGEKSKLFQEWMGDNINAVLSTPMGELFQLPVIKQAVEILGIPAVQDALNGIMMGAGLPGNVATIPGLTVQQEAFAAAKIGQGLRQAGKAAGQVGREIAPAARRLAKEQRGFVVVPGEGGYLKGKHGGLETLTDEAVKIGTEENKKFIKSFLSLPDDDQMKYVSNLLNDIKLAEQEGSEAQATLETLKTVVTENPLSHWRGQLGNRRVSLLNLLAPDGGFKESFTLKEANMLKNYGLPPSGERQISKSVIDKRGRVPSAYIIDEISSEMGMTEEEFMTSLQRLRKDNQELQRLKGLPEEKQTEVKQLKQLMGILDIISEYKLPVKPPIPEAGALSQGQVQTGLQGFGKEASQVDMLGEFTGKTAGEQTPLVDAAAIKAREAAKPLPGQTAMPLEAKLKPPEAPTVKEPLTVPEESKVHEWLSKGITREVKEEMGQALLDELDNMGINPHAISKKFWADTYFRLDESAQAKMRNYARRLSGIKDDDIMKAAKFIDDDLPSEISGLEDTERGYVAMMEAANRKVVTETAKATQIPKVPEAAQPVKAEKALPARKPLKPPEAPTLKEQLTMPVTERQSAGTLWLEKVRKLDERNAPDFEYRGILSTGAKGSLKKGETWRDKVVRYAENDLKTHPVFPEAAQPVKAEKALPARKPLWSEMEDARVKPPGVEPPTPAQTPSGRKPGGVANIKSEPPIDNYQRVVNALKPPESATTMSGKVELKKNDLLRAMYDRNWELKDLEKATGVPAHKLAQVVPGATAAGEDLIRRFFRPVWQAVAKDAEFLEQYMVLMRNQDILVRNPAARLPGAVQGHGGTLQALETLKNKIGPERFKNLQDVGDKLWKLNDELVLNPLKEEGILDARSYTQIKSSNPHYIPFQRADFTDMIDNALSKPEASLSASGIQKMELTGSDRALDNPLARLEAGLIKTQNVIARNRAAKGIVAALQEQEKLTGMKLVQKVGDKAEHSAITDTISFFRDGKKEVVQVPAIYAQIAKGMEAESGNVLNTILSALSAPLRHGAVTYNPAFLIVNPIRDATSAFFREKLIPLSPEYIKGWISVVRKDASFSEAAQSGALLSGIVDTMRTTDAMKRAKALGSIKVNSPKDALLLIPRLIERANVTAEQATRLATFKKLRAEGIDALDAAVRSRDVTVDFAKSGNVMKVINQVIPFSNAALQGTANVIRTIKANPKWAAAAGAAFIAPTVLSRVNNMRFETSKLIPDYEYTNNWVIQIGEGEKKDKTKFPIYFKIPKGPLGSMLTFPGEALFNLSQYDNNRSAVETVLNAGLEAGKTTLPVDPSVSGILPPILRTGAGIATKQNIYAGQPIIPRREEKLLPEQQFGAETSQFATVIGKAFRVSPRLIQFAITDFTAGTGQTGLWLLDLGLDALGYNPEPFKGAEQPELTGVEQTSKTPVISRFLGTKGTQELRSGWDNFDRAAEDTNRLFNQIPEMNRLGIRLGEVPDKIKDTELTPQQRAEYQGMMAETVVKGISELDLTVLPDNKKAEAVKEKMAELKAQAKEDFINQQGIPPTEKELTDARYKEYQKLGKMAQQLFLLDNPEFAAWAEKEKDVKKPTLPREFLEEGLAYEPHEKAYQEIKGATPGVTTKLREQYLKDPESAAYAMWRTKREGLELGVPQEQIKDFVLWKDAEDKLEKEMYLKEHPEFYQTAKELGLVDKEIDFAKVPTRKVKDWFDKYSKIAPEPGKDWERLKSRFENPEGDVWLRMVNPNLSPLKERDIFVINLKDDERQKFDVWEKMTANSDEARIFLLKEENKGLYDKMVAEGITKEVSEKKARELTYALTPKLKGLIKKYENLPTGGLDQERLRFDNPELNEYLIKAKGMADISDATKKKLSFFQSPELQKLKKQYDDIPSWDSKGREQFRRANPSFNAELEKDKDVKPLGPEKPKDHPLYAEYLKLPLGKARTDFRRSHPELEKWGVENKRWAPLPTGTRIKAPAIPKIKPPKTSRAPAQKTVSNASAKPRRVSGRIRSKLGGLL